MRYTSFILRSIILMLFLLITLIVHSSPQSNEQAMDPYSQLHEQGVLFLDQNNYQQALLTLNQAVQGAAQAQDDVARATILLSLARLHYTIYNFDHAALQVHNAIELLRNESAPDLIAQAQTLLGFIYTENGKWEEAEIFLHLADQYYSNNGISDARALVLLGYGALSIKQKVFGEAINYLEAAKISLNNQEKIKDLARCALLLAEAYIKIDPDQLPNALNKARLALAQAKSIGQETELESIEI